MDLRVIHPVPLPVQDVVPDLHVLEDLRCRVGRGAGDPGWAETGSEQRHPRQHREPAMHLDHAGDVAAVAVSEVPVDLVVDRVELAAELLDLLGAEARERALDLGGFGFGGCHQALFSSFIDRSRRGPRGR
jgi:hypothetical protein